MKIIHLEEHTCCSNYVTDMKIGFKYLEVEQGVVFNVENKQNKHLFFFLEGRVKVRYNEFPYKEFGAGEMIFLPKSADCQGEALTRTTFIVLIYDNPVRLCNKVEFNKLVELTKQLKYDFNSLPILPILTQYLTLLRDYLQGGMNCRYLHEIKQQELFFIFRGYYEKERLAMLFYPMLGESPDFRSKVMANYCTVKTAKELASTCGYSVRRFNELFVEEFGSSPYNWILKQKSKHIIGRLSQGNICLKEIIDEFQFSDASHFNKYCFKQYGKTPLQLRHELCSGNQSFTE